MQEGFSEFSKYEQAISKARLSKYKYWALGDKHVALELYKINQKMSVNFYKPLSVFELFLRNAIHAAMTEAYGECWIFYAGEYINENDHRTKDKHKSIGYKQKQEVKSKFNYIKRKNIKIHPDRFVGELSFSFWTTMFNKAYSEQWSQVIHRIFTNDTKKRFTVDDIDRIRDITFRVRRFRNRAMHHEPIIGEKMYTIYDNIAEICCALSPHAQDIFCREIHDKDTFFRGYTNIPKNIRNRLQPKPSDRTGAKLKYHQRK